MEPGTWTPSSSTPGAAVPLLTDGFRDTTELLSVLTGWRWQVVQAAREAGASWKEIGAAIGASAEQAEAEHAAAVGSAKLQPDSRVSP